MAKNTLFSPVFFTTFGEINFDNYDTQKALVLLYLFVHCKSGDFFVTLSKFKQELGLNKGVLGRITSELKEEALIDYETRGHSNTTHYKVDYKKIATKTFLEKFFKTKDSAATYQPYFQEVARQAVLKQVPKTRGKSEISPAIMPTIESIRVRLEQLYNEARSKAPKEGTFEGFGASKANLPFDKVHKQKVNRLITLQGYTAENVINSFRAYIFNHYAKPERERHQVTNPVSYFLKEKEGSFPVFFAALNHYNEMYAQRKS